MKVAFDAGPLLDGEKTGVGYVEDNFVRQLVKKQKKDIFYTQYFAFRNEKVAAQRIAAYEAVNVKIRHCKFFGGVYRLLSALLPIPYSLFFKDKVDITHFFNFIIPPLVKGKRVVTIHDMAFRRFPETVRAKTKWLLKLSLWKTFKRADCIIAVSEFTKQEILQFYNYPTHKIKVVYNGIDLNTYHPSIEKGVIEQVREKFRISKEYILYLGTLEPRKNIERLIEAYALAQQEQELPLLVIAGRKGWLYDSIFKKVAELNIVDSVLFTGYVSDEDKPPLLAGAKYFCFPSLYEGFGLPPLEAMACGTPVISSNTASLPEVCGDAAVYANPFDVSAIADALLRLNNDSELRSKLREKGFEQVKRFDWEKLADELYSVYEGLVLK